MSNNHTILSTPKLKKFSQFQGFNVDKTGYNEIKMGALKKIIAFCSGVHGGVSIGPYSEIESNGDDDESSFFLIPDESDYCSTPVSKNGGRRNHVTNQISKKILDQHNIIEEGTEMDGNENSFSRYHLKAKPSDTALLPFDSDYQNVVEVMKKMQEFEKAKERARWIRMDRAKEFTGKQKILDYLKTVSDEFGLQSKEGGGRETIEQRLGEECNNEEQSCKIEELLTEDGKIGDSETGVEEMSIKVENDNREEFIRKQEMEEMAKREETARLEQIAKIEQAEREEMIRKQKIAEELAKKEEEKQKEKIHAIRILYDNIYLKEKEFSECYQEFAKIITVYNGTKLMDDFHEDIQNIKNANNDMVKLIDKCKGGDLQESDLIMSVNCCNLISLIVKKLKEEAAKLEESSTMEVKIIENMESHSDKEIKTEVAAASSKEDLSRESILLNHFNSLLDNLIKTEESLVDFLKDDTLKKFRADCRIAVNTPVNAISSVSASHMLDKLNRLSNLLKGNPVIVKERRFSASHHPLGITYCTSLLSEKIIKQGEQVVSSKPDSAFPIAAVVLALWSDFPDFGDLLLAHFYRTCPYLIPVFWVQEPGETDEEYSKKLGFLYVNNEKEDINMYLKRMSGVTRLYCAMMITSVRKSSSGPRRQIPIGPWEGWRWCASFVNHEPKAQISATLLLDMLEVTGSTMLKKYHHQFQKLLHLICKVYIPKIDQVTKEDHKGPVSRLKNFLETVIYSKSIPPPKGVIPVNFW